MLMFQDCANNIKKAKMKGSQKSKSVKTVYYFQTSKEEFQGVGAIEYFRVVHL